ncbi:thromboxane A2 receptor-like [Saccostrea echinata]|uniref:thromboxane A2 receptor-like n=1 Tax=Saccostrea echinata TaxID=191078 RepID=UPI002A7FBF7F|nr:thromboxane A2 receptor-like [Saccostrea echinata]
MASGYCYTEDLTNLTNHLSEKHSVAPSAIMFSLGVGGNVLAISLLIKHSNTHHWSVFYRLVAGLTVTDLFGVLSSSPLAFVVYSNKFRWVGGQPACDYMSFVLILSSVSTMLIATAMSLDRFFAVWFPFLYKSMEKRRRVHVILASLWIFALLISSLPLIGLGHNIRHFPCTWCFFDYFGTTPTDIAFSIIFASLGIFVIVSSSIINILVLIKIVKEAKGVNRGISIRSRKGQKRARRNEFFIMTFIIAILLTCVICWMPLMIRILTNVSKQQVPDYSSDLLGLRFASWNQILDPWIYILLRKEMLTRLYKLYRRLFTDTDVSEFSLNAEKSYAIDNSEVCHKAKTINNSIAREEYSDTNDRQRPSGQEMTLLLCNSNKPLNNSDGKGNKLELS